MVEGQVPLPLDLTFILLVKKDEKSSYIKLNILTAFTKNKL